MRKGWAAAGGAAAGCETPAGKMKPASLKSFFQPKKAVVEKVVRETPDLRSLLIRPEGGFRFEPGQFAMVTAAEAGEAPFAPSSSPDETETVRITAKKTTDGIQAARAGDFVGIRGPYGKPFSFAPSIHTEMAFAVRGIGLAAARPFILRALAMRESFHRMALWTHPADALPCAGDIPSWKTAIEVIHGESATGSGRPTTCADSLMRSGFRPERAAALLFCGREENRELARALSGAGFGPESIFLWTETRMNCAVGHCRRCTLDHLFVCREGPLIPLAALSGLRSFGALP